MAPETHDAVLAYYRERLEFLNLSELSRRAGCDKSLFRRTLTGYIAPGRNATRLPDASVLQLIEIARELGKPLILPKLKRRTNG